MSDVLYTKDHEWVRLQGDLATLGISDYAQQQLGDVVFVELPEIGRRTSRGGSLAVVESVKAASDIYAPLSGEVVETNGALESDPALVNRSAEDEGWFVTRLMTGELRQGALAGVMSDAVAKAADVPLAAVRRAAMLSGDLGHAASVALCDGEAALGEIGLSVLRAVQPMLAATSATVAEALAAPGPASV